MVHKEDIVNFSVKPTNQIYSFSFTGVEEFLEKELQLMNKYRLMHAAAPLQLSLDLTNKAELWATQLANQDKEKIDVNSKYGQNIFSTKDEKDVATKSVQSWYNQIRFYDFHSAKESLKSSYFTQLVWVGSQEVGIGKAKSSTGKTYIVALFNPPGNKGNFLHNVLPVTGLFVKIKAVKKRHILPSSFTSSWHITTISTLLSK